LRTQAIAHIAIIDLFLGAELLHDPGLCGKAVIIGGEGGVIKKGSVLTASKAALALGIRPGQSMRKAMKAHVGITAILPRYESVDELSKKFFAILRGANPSTESFGPDEAFIFVELRGETPEGGENVFTAAKRLAERLQAGILKETGLHTAVGIAPNKLLARLAGQGAKKDEVVVVTKNNASAFVKKLPIIAIPYIDRSAVKLLRAIKMDKMEELTTTPLLFFEKNFGRSRGRVIFDSVGGRGPVEVRPFFNPNGICEEVTFDEGVSDAALIKKTLYMLTEDLAARLKEGNDLCRAISVKITLNNFACIVKTKNIEEETDSLNTIREAASELLEDMPVKEEILLVGIMLQR